MFRIINFIKIGGKLLVVGASGEKRGSNSNKQGFLPVVKIFQI